MYQVEETSLIPESYLIIFQIKERDHILRLKNNVNCELFIFLYIEIKS